MRVVTCAVVLGLVAMVANAAEMDSRLQLVIQADGSTTIEYTGATDYAVFDGYQILSLGGNLLPGNVGDNTKLGPPIEDYDGYIPGTWKSIFDYKISGEGGTVDATLGGGAASFAEANPTALQVAEINQGGVGFLIVDATWSIGTVSGAPSVEDLTFLWHEPTGGDGTTWEGEVIVIPEPTTMAVLGLGLVGFIARKKRS